MCFLQSVTDMKNLPQTLHVSAILFWWVVKCLTSLYLSVNTALHNSHANPAPKNKKKNARDDEIEMLAKI